MLSGKKYRSIILIIIIISFACFMGASPALSDSGKQPYKIGGIFAVTGPASFLGDPEKSSMELVIDQINKKGGIDGHICWKVLSMTQKEIPPKRSWVPASSSTKTT